MGMQVLIIIPDAISPISTERYCKADRRGWGSQYVEYYEMYVEHRLFYIGTSRVGWKIFIVKAPS